MALVKDRAASIGLRKGGTAANSLSRRSFSSFQAYTSWHFTLAYPLLTFGRAKDLSQSNGVRRKGPLPSAKREINKSGHTAKAVPRPQLKLRAGTHVDSLPSCKTRSIKSG